VTDTIVYHGLGYVGLTGAIHFAKSGVNVIGYDIDQSVVDAVNAGKPKAGEFLGYLGGTNLQIGDKPRNRLPFRATTDFTEVCAHRIHIIAVPTEKDGEPWMLLVRHVVWTLLDVLPIGSLIIIESTLTPGTIDQLMKEYTGGTHGCLIAHAPRRDWFADPEKNLATIPRVVGGFTPGATEAAVKVLEDVTPAELILQTDHRTAELVKPLENALFHLPIMLAHEMALIYPGHDVREAVRLASTHWRFASFGGLYLGMGSGGRCVPLGPKYLVAGAEVASVEAALHDPKPYLLTSALDTEQEITRWTALAIDRAVGTTEVDRATRVAILGIAYRPGFADLGFSPALRLAQQLRNAHAHWMIDLHDATATPAAVQAAVIPDRFGNLTGENPDVFATPAELAVKLGIYDVVVVVTPHWAAYEDLGCDAGRVEYGTLPWRPGQIIFDARGIWSGYAERFAQLGVTYHQVGTPGWLG
jgi:UDP-N-acetyl-D-glucosamine dehydrogenase